MATCTRFLLVAVSFALSIPALAATWQQPAPEELKMTAEPAAPGASAIYLFREEIADDKLHFHSVYVRMKILTEEGKKYRRRGDARLISMASLSLSEIQARTIHSDGTVIPFTGKPFEKLCLEDQVSRAIRPRSSLCRTSRSAAFSNTAINWTTATTGRLAPLVHPAGPVCSQGSLSFSADGSGARRKCKRRLSYTRVLPAGVEVKYAPMQNTYEVSVQNIPATPTEDYMPPVHSLTYRVLFYYTTIFKVDEFWKEKGKNWSKEMDRFAAPSKLIRCGATDHAARGQGQRKGKKDL